MGCDEVVLFEDMGFGTRPEAVFDKGLESLSDE
jgi:hypothetical protein